MKNYIACILLLSLLTGCSEQPKCDSPEAVSLAKDLIKQELKSDQNILNSVLYSKEDESLIDRFVDENIELKTIRTIEKKEDLKSCKCASKIVFQFSEAYQVKMKEEYRKMFKSDVVDDDMIASSIDKMINKQLDYNYNLQVLDNEDKLYIEGDLAKEELSRLVLDYININHNSEPVSAQSTQKQSDSIALKAVETDYYFAIVKSVVAPVYEQPKLYTKTQDSYSKGDTIHFKELRDGWILFDYYGEDNSTLTGYCKVEDLTIKKR